VIAALGQPKTVEPKTAEDCKISAKPAVIPFPGVGHCGKQVWTPGLRDEKNDCSVRQAHVEVVKQAIITIGSSIRFNPRRLTAPVPILRSIRHSLCRNRFSSSGPTYAINILIGLERNSGRNFLPLMFFS